MWIKNTHSKRYRTNINTQITLALIIHNQRIESRKLTSAVRSMDLDTVADWEHALYSFLKNWLDDSACITVQTSGSTGAPKSISLPKEMMKASARLTNEFFGLNENSTALLCLSAGYIAGKMMVIRALTGNYDLYVHPPESAPKIDTQYDFCAMVPMQVELLLQNSEGEAQLNKINKLMIGGSTVTSALQNRLQSLQTACYSTYGMTETVSHIALQRLNGVNQSDCYNALQGVHFTTDERDCLVIHAPHLQPTPFITNDVVTLFHPTSFRWLGRYDNVINSGGIKLHPEILAKKIESYLNRRYYFCSAPDTTLGEKLILMIEGEPFDTENLEIQLRTALSKYEFPKEIRFMEKFEETGNGKVKMICEKK